MRKVLDGFAVVCVVGLLVTVMLQCGCSPAAQVHEEHVIVAGSYAAELDLCVKRATTLAESQECRCRVAENYKRPCDGTDGGAP